MLLSILKKVCLSFFGLEFAHKALTVGVCEYFATSHLYSDRTPVFFLLVRLVGALLRLCNQKIEETLIEVQPTNTWLRFCFYWVLIYIYCVVPYYWYYDQLLVKDQPRRWKRMLSLYECLSRNGQQCFQQEVKKFSSQYHLTGQESNALLRKQKFVLYLCILTSLNFNFSIFSIVLFLVIQWFRTCEGSDVYLVVLQSLWLLVFKYSFNFLSIYLAVVFFFYFSNCLFFMYRLKSINRKSKLMLENTFVFLFIQKKIFSDRYSRLKSGFLFTRRWNECPAVRPDERELRHHFRQNSHAACSNALWMIKGQPPSSNGTRNAIGVLADELHFVRTLVSPILSTVYICATYSTLAYTFLYFFTPLLNVNRLVLIAAAGAVSVPLLPTLCMFGQTLITQVKNGMLILFCGKVFRLFFGANQFFL